jgi:precorrin-6B methylase 1
LGGPDRPIGSSRPIGSLLVVGTGIAAVGHVTLEARRAIEGADEVLYAVPDPLTREWIARLNPASSSIWDLYRPVPDRHRAIYQQMADRILRPVRAGRRTCAVFYGHPGVAVKPTQIAIAAARAEGHRVRMLPAVSSDDCLFADLGLDPGNGGCQTYEATDFLVRPRSFDTCTPLVLWQIGVVGLRGWPPSRDVARAGLGALAEMLAEHYGPDHRVIVYEASLLGICDPRLDEVSLRELPDVNVSSASTLYVPRLRPPERNPEWAQRVGYDRDEPHGAPKGRP